MSLRAAGADVSIYDGVSPEPPDTNVEATVAAGLYAMSHAIEVFNLDRAKRQSGLARPS